VIGCAVAFVVSGSLLGAIGMAFAFGFGVPRWLLSS
jgi:tight adherence protein B